MSESPPRELRADWTAANQGLLAAEFARLAGLLEGADDAGLSAACRDAASAVPGPAAVDSLTQVFGLSAFERDLLLLCAGVEMAGELAGLCARAGQGRPHATFGLALAVLPDAHWSALAPTGPLRRWRLVEPADDTSLTAARLRIDERVLHYLAGVNYLDPRLQPLLRPVAATPAMAQSHEAVANDIVAALRRLQPGPMPVLQLGGDDVHGRRDVAARAAARSGVDLWSISGDDVPANAHEADAFVRLWEREGALLQGALLVECAEPPAAAVVRLAERAGGLLLLSVPEPVPVARPDLRYRVDVPRRGDQLRLWQAVLDGSAARFGSALDGVAAEFRLSAHDIAAVGARMREEVAALPDPQAALWQACRGRERVHLGGLAQRIEPAARWDDLVLPDPQKATLRQIAVQVRHRLTVYERWGFGAATSRGLGITALFSGESGTGKTMAAEVLADELHLDLYRIDLSAVVSKYIGETEKNLARLFDAADRGGSILFFDEADALFGKRSEVKDSHDRYANIEVSYLLQRMEAYRGLAILTTNQKSALDPAFHRRLRFVVHFPFPDAAQREEIWRRVFPPGTPTAGLAFDKLARLHAAGGHIRNIALAAAFGAADAGEPVAMPHLLEAAHAEAAKRERVLSDAETRGWA